MRILCLSGYDAASHRRWRRGLADHLDEHDWTMLALPARHFRWRIRGNALTWAFGHRHVLEQTWDVVLATSMVDLSALRGFAPGLAGALNVVYFHENQFAFPTSPGQHEDVTPAVVNLYSALCADRVAFNSRHNCDSFLDGADAFLRRMPDGVPDGVVERIRQRAHVLPVPLDDGCFGPPTPRSGPLSIVWNHRWEYDKAPDRFFEALRRVSARGLDFALHVVGQQFRRRPDAFDRAQRDLGEHIATWGYVEDPDTYCGLLANCDLVVSSALHEFQGLAMLEAMALGCRPLAPNRLAYPEYVPPDWLYASYPDDAEREIAALTDRLAELCAQPSRVRESAPVDVSGFRWGVLGDRYRNLLRPR